MQTGQRFHAQYDCDVSWRCWSIINRCSLHPLSLRRRISVRHKRRRLQECRWKTGFEPSAWWKWQARWLMYYFCYNKITGRQCIYVRSMLSRFPPIMNADDTVDCTIQVYQLHMCRSLWTKTMSLRILWLKNVIVTTILGHHKGQKTRPFFCINERSCKIAYVHAYILDCVRGKIKMV